MNRVVCSALLVVLIAASPSDAVAQSFVCYAMTRGESATHAARRITGTDQNAYQQWFQIMDRSSRFVPKSQYNRIGTGWRACVIKPAIRSVSSNANRVEEREAATASIVPRDSEVAPVLPAPTPLARVKAGVKPQAAADSLREFGRIDLTMLWLSVAMVVPWFGWRFVGDYLARRQTASIVVQCFVQRFVEEFERPLVQYNDVGERPVRSRLRLGVRRGRFSILLAPGEGRVYPNLSDHKKNVEYDVDRVMRVIADHSFVSGVPYTKAGWIVVPFQFTLEPNQSGVTCISSL